MSSNYAGVSNIDLNPSAMIFSKCSYDINIASVDAGFLNNSFYNDPKFVFPTLFKNDIKFALANILDTKKLKAADFIIQKNLQNSTFLYASANIKGPSFMYSNGNEAFAITTAFRAGTSMFGLPSFLVQAGYTNIYDPTLYNNPYTVSKNVDAAAMAWLEIGGSYAKKLVETPEYVFAGGASVKLLIGYSGGYALSNGIDCYIPYRANFTAINLNLSYGHSITNDKNHITLTNPLGSGVSGDIGFTIMKKKGSKQGAYYGCPDVSGRKSKVHIVSKEYKWKLGMSMIDLGGINFSSNAASYTYKNVAYSWDTITKVNVKTLKQIDQLIYKNYDGASNATVKNSFFIWAPSAASAQFDYNFNNLFYANLSIIQRIVIPTQARLARMNSLAVTPRYERSDIEIAMPIILNEYIYPNLGLMIRYKSFFIGSDQIGSTFGLTSLYGMNVYFGIKISNIGTGVRFKDPKIAY